MRSLTDTTKEISNITESWNAKVCQGIEILHSTYESISYAEDPMLLRADLVRARDIFYKTLNTADGNFNKSMHVLFEEVKYGRTESG